MGFYSKLKKMKKNIFAIVVALATTIFSANVANAQGEEQRSVVGKDGKFSEVAEPFREIFAGQANHQSNMLVNNKIYWMGETIPGWKVGARVGGSLDGWLGGVSVGYAGMKVNVDVSVRMGQVNFFDQKYVAPSAFLEFKPILFKWGNYESNSLYLGPKVGYQYARTRDIINEATDDYTFYREAHMSGSGFAAGAVIGWEKLSFMSGHRFNVELAAHWYDVKWLSNSNETLKNGLSVELTVGWNFVFHKKARNF